VVFLIFANLVNPYILGSLLVVILLLCEEKMRMLNFLFMMSISIYLLSILKSIYQDPRPYMVYSVTPKERYAEYGNPSGHVCLGYVCVAYLFERCLIKRKIYFSGKEARPIKPLIKWYALMIFVLAGIGMSRLYLGMHSVD